MRANLWLAHALGGTRTHNAPILSRRPLPLGYQGLCDLQLGRERAGDASSGARTHNAPILSRRPLPDWDTEANRSVQAPERARRDSNPQGVKLSICNRAPLPITSLLAPMCGPSRESSELLDKRETTQDSNPHHSELRSDASSNWASM